MMRWTAWILGTLLLTALAAQPAQAVQVDLTIIDTKGNALPGYTIVFNWPKGQTSSLTTDSTGRLHGDVPKGEHFCSLWAEGLHLASGLCNLTDAPGSEGNGGQRSGKAESSRTSGGQKSSGQANSIAPPPTASERAAARAVERAELTSYEKRKGTAASRLWWGFRGAPAGDHLIFLSGNRLGSYEFGVVLAQLFGLDGSGGDGGGGGDGGN